MASKYPNLTQDEVGLLVQSKYKLDSDMYSDEEVRMSQLQLKIDGAEAKQGINTLRDSYAAPQAEEQPTGDVEGFIDDEWISKMEREVDTLTGLEFDLGNESPSPLDDSYKSELKSKRRLEQFFDPYVREDGSWDYDTLFAQSPYRQRRPDYSVCVQTRHERWAITLSLQRPTYLWIHLQRKYRSKALHLLLAQAL